MAPTNKKRPKVACLTYIDNNSSNARIATMQKISNRAKREIIFFDKLAENADINYYWGWKTLIGRFRYQFRADIIISHLGLKKGTKVLEIGCFVGELTKMVAYSNATIFAVDIAPKSITLAKTRIKKKNITFEVDNIENSKFINNSFSAIFGNAILHHTNLSASSLEIKRILKPGGKYIFFEPNLLNPEIFLERKIPVLRRLSNGSPDETAYIRWNLKKTLEKIGFKKVKIEPFDFIYPALPYYFLPLLKFLSKILEKTPLIKEISGSLIVTGEK